jgi:hypothetical protein
MPDGRVCTLCKEWKTAACFSPNGAYLSSRCKVCHNRIGAEHSRANRKPRRLDTLPIQVPCQNCRKLFTTCQNRLDAGAGKYCSRACVSNAAINRLPLCLTCGHRLKDRRATHCRTCANVAKVKKVSFDCDQCGTHFERCPSQIKSELSFCSLKCKGAWRRDHPAPLPPKCCLSCNETDPSAFYSDRQRRDGLTAYCKTCILVQSHEWYQQHPDKKRETSRKWRDTHREHHREVQRLYRIRHPERATNNKPGYYQARYQKDKERLRERARLRGRRDPVARKIHKRNYDARKRGAEGTFTRSQWQALCGWFGSICLGCGANAKLEVDHVVPLSRGGTNWIQNLQPLCRTCNASKRAKTIDYRDPAQLAAFLVSIGVQPE